MKKIIIGLIVLIVFVLGAFFILKSPAWKTYENTRYEFSVDYPGNWDLVEAPTNNDGREFISSDNEISCRAYGFKNSLQNSQGNPQTLDQFLDWFVEDEAIKKVLARSNTALAGRDAQELVTLWKNGMIARAVYTLDSELGKGLVCYYPNDEIMKEQNENFKVMKKSFTISPPSNMTECSVLLKSGLEPIKDFQNFSDTKYTEVTTTARNAWDKNRLPSQVITLENKGYFCFPMPDEFDYTTSENGVIAEPEVTAVAWNCELKYNDWKYLDGNDSAGKQAIEKAGFSCEQEKCLADGSESNVWFCTK